MTGPVAVAILSKTPGFTDAKTRLAAAIGKTRASQLHAILVERTLRMAEALSHADGVSVYLAPAEPSNEAHRWWQSKGLTTIQTGQGHLGWRMHTVHKNLLPHHTGCVLIGTDCLCLRVAHVASAASLLDRESGVIGPCHDGGFYLFGSRFPVPQDCWTQPAWGSRNAQEQFLCCLQQAGYGNIKTLDIRADLDTIEDAGQALAELPQDDPDRASILECLGMSQPRQACR